MKNGQLTPEEFAVIMAPIYRLCREEKGGNEQGRHEFAATYFAILKNVDARYLRAAVVQYLATATEPWFPMPAVLLQLARDARRAERQRAIENAPDCPVCENTGLVSARPRDSRQRFRSLRCVACARGFQFSRHERFDAATMETWREHGLRLVGPVTATATIPLPDLSVPAPAVGPKGEQLRAIKAK